MHTFRYHNTWVEISEIWNCMLLLVSTIAAQMRTKLYYIHVLLICVWQ